MKCYILLFLFIISSFSTHAGITGPELVDSAGLLYAKTLKQASRSEFDSALLTIREAYAFGLSDDSLYYAWAEIYSAKGALDTAIALSLAVKTKPGHPLYYSVLKQRYLLFTLTNQTKRAESVFDILNKLSAYRVRYLIPEISFSVRGGVQQNSIKEAEILPSYLYYAYPEDEPARTAASGGLNLLWKYPIRKTVGLELTAGANLYQYSPPHPFQLKNALDSSYSEKHVQLRYYILSGMISCSYEFSSIREYSGSVSFNHKADLSALTFIKEFFVFGNTGYSYDAGGKVHNWNGILFGSREWSKRRSNSISISVSGVFDKNDSIRVHDTYRKLYTDGNVLYLDSMAPQPVTQFYMISNYSITDTLFTIFPRSYINAKLSLTQQFKLKHNFSLGVTIDGASNWFIDSYSWVESLYSNMNIPKPNGMNTLVQNRIDGSKNWAANLFPLQLDSLLKSERTVHKKKRVDQIITANVSFKKSFKNSVTIGVNSTVSRTFSNLRSYALVDIPDWSYSVMAFSTFRFNPAGRLR
ncbi:MAG: hypothetical protein JW915_01265 [Chitinispirillaceae bacterium]|nr:hypothetical protein [Chitinispirillaceae bacterium]